MQFQRPVDRKMGKHVGFESDLHFEALRRYECQRRPPTTIARSFGPAFERRARVKEYLQGRVVVISPHLDDAVLSLGSTIAAAARRGAAVEILSVFCGHPDSQAPAGPWDSKSGFGTEGEASRTRRQEDRSACAILGATAHWAPFGDEQYDRRGDEEEVGAAVTTAVDGADVVLIPGWPLENSDHAWLSGVLLKKRINCHRLGLYLEQPYAFYRGERGPVTVAASLQPLLRTVPPWHHLSASRADCQLKRKAVTAYRSQARQLGLRFLGVRRLLQYESMRGGEAIAWLPQQTDRENFKARERSLANQLLRT
jgi:LmbE family N-acetylglucosaminyl deacetylase